ncbi:hypothetical protein BBP40_011077 [Aspergillus hancockii]|nr:hypothetical protein BBP40_011077 [Aspergillus hancockii]
MLTGLALEMLRWTILATGLPPKRMSLTYLFGVYDYNGKPLIGFPGALEVPTSQHLTS